MFQLILVIKTFINKSKINLNYLFIIKYVYFGDNKRWF